VASFYHFFSFQPKTAHTFVVCLGTACYVAGALGLVETLNQRCAKPENSDIRKDIGVQTARCIGSCGLAPAVIVDGKVFARVTPQVIRAELERFGVK
jgi:bidirectional [NiFe] hydrogenase diaphorase subunit